MFPDLLGFLTLVCVRLLFITLGTEFGLFSSWFCSPCVSDLLGSSLYYYGLLAQRLLCSVLTDSPYFWSLGFWCLYFGSGPLDSSLLCSGFFCSVSLFLLLGFDLLGSGLVPDFYFWRESPLQYFVPAGLVFIKSS